MIVTLVIALASIVIGELVPKTLALNFPERFALLVARPIGFLQTLLSPIVWLVSRIAPSSSACSAAGRSPRAATSRPRS